MQVRRLHRDLVDDAGEAQHLEQRDGAADDEHAIPGDRSASSRTALHLDLAPCGFIGALSSRPIVLIDSSRSVCHRRAVIAPNSGRSTMRLSRSRGQCVSTTSMMRPGPRRHHADAVGEHRRLVERVGDEEDRRRGLAPQAQELVAHQEARLLVERAERLVEQDQARLHDERARDAHALAHAARELRRIAGREVGQGRRASARRARACAFSAALSFARRRPNATLPATSSQGSEASSWNTTPMPSGALARDRAGPRTRSLPSVAGVRPAISSSSVDLPQPDGPTTAKNSPFGARSRSGPPHARRPYSASPETPW